MYNLVMSASGLPEPRKLNTIRTARVSRAKRELIDALTDAARQSGLTHDRAEGKLSALIVEVWDEAERRIRHLRLSEQD